jgi:hypothetical protein
MGAQFMQQFSGKQDIIQQDDSNLENLVADLFFCRYQRDFVLSSDRIDPISRIRQQNGSSTRRMQQCLILALFLDRNP